MEESGWVTRYGDGYTFTYPVGATIHVEIDDAPDEPIRKWRSREERERG